MRNGSHHTGQMQAAYSMDAGNGQGMSHQKHKYDNMVASADSGYTGSTKHLASIKTGVANHRSYGNRNPSGRKADGYERSLPTEGQRNYLKQHMTPAQLRLDAGSNASLSSRQHGIGPQSAQHSLGPRIGNNQYTSKVANQAYAANQMVISTHNRHGLIEVNRNSAPNNYW